MCPCGSACRCNPCRCGSRRSGHGSTHSHSHAHVHVHSGSHAQPSNENTAFHGHGQVLGPVHDGHHTGRNLDPRGVHQAIWTPIPQSYLDLARAGVHVRSGNGDRNNTLLVNNDDPRVGEIPGHGMAQLLMDQLDSWKRSALTTHDGAPRPLNGYLFPDPHMRELFGDDYMKFTPDEYMRCLDEAVNVALEEITGRPQGPQGPGHRNN
ncbi:hypothetical protein K445DRAFT_317238 [Daldinia sp. EC12]|nr:hypothetical protein K445DRAFT_317238 [Daldinia sp. EC12]